MPVSSSSPHTEGTSQEVKYKVEKLTRKEDFISFQGALYSSSSVLTSGRTTTTALGATVTDRQRSNSRRWKGGLSSSSSSQSPGNPSLLPLAAVTSVAELQDLLRRRKPFVEEFMILTSRTLTNHRKNVS
jgi:hypothetical protein